MTMAMPDRRGVAGTRSLARPTWTAGRVHGRGGARTPSSGSGNHDGARVQLSRPAGFGPLRPAAAAGLVSAPVAIRSPGQPLLPSTRAFMEARLGQSFEDVRIHADDQAAAASQAVHARAFTIGRHIGFGRGEYLPSTDAGRRLIAHELTHVVQQRGYVDSWPALRLGSADDPAETEAERVESTLLGAGTHMGAGRHEPAIRRRLVIDPPGAIPEIANEANEICPSEFPPESPVSGRIEASCSTSSTHGCHCLCDAAADPARTYTIQVRPAMVIWSNQTLHDGTTRPVPTSSIRPHTARGPNPTSLVPDPASSNGEFGAFDGSGAAFWYRPWRILAHELCGHGRLNQTYTGGAGNRPGHDITIDTENAMAAEHGERARGHDGDRRQGESFFNPIGDRSKVLFSLRDGLHYEAP
jgi:hypothetical protein